MDKGSQYVPLEELSLPLDKQNPLILLDVDPQLLTATFLDSKGRKLTKTLEECNQAQYRLVDRVPEKKKGESRDVTELEQIKEQIKLLSGAIGKAVKRGKSLDRLRTDLGTSLSDEELTDHLAYYGCRVENGCVYLPLGLTDPADINRWVELAGFDTEKKDEDIWEESLEEEQEPVESKATIVDVNDDTELLTRLLECVADSILRLHKRYRRKNIPPYLKDVVEGVQYLINNIEEEFRYPELAGLTIDADKMQEIVEELDCTINDAGVVQLPGWIDTNVITPVTWVEQLTPATESPFDDDDEVEAETTVEDDSKIIGSITPDSEGKPQLRLFHHGEEEDEEESSEIVGPGVNARLAALETAVTLLSNRVAAICAFNASFAEVLSNVEQAIAHAQEEEDV